MVDILSVNLEEIAAEIESALTSEFSPSVRPYLGLSFDFRFNKESHSYVISVSSTTQAIANMEVMSEVAGFARGYRASLRFRKVPV